MHTVRTQLFCPFRKCLFHSASICTCYLSPCKIQAVVSYLLSSTWFVSWPQPRQLMSRLSHCVNSLWKLVDTTLSQAEPLTKGNSAMVEVNDWDWKSRHVPRKVIIFLEIRTLELNFLVCIYLFFSYNTLNSLEGHLYSSAGCLLEVFSMKERGRWGQLCLLPCPLLFFFFNDIHKIRGFFLVNTKFEKWNVGDILGISVSRKQYETKNNASNLGFFCYFYLFIFFFHFLAHWHSSRVIISGQRRMHRHCQSTALCCAVDTVKDTWP